jgi:hypothetical protein
VTYLDSERDGHYLGTTPPDQCPVCLAGMAVTHGRRDVQWRDRCPTCDATERTAFAGTCLTRAEGAQLGDPDPWHATEPATVCYCGSGLDGHSPDHARRPRADYIFRQVARCRGCHGRMAWWETPAGKWSPHDLDGTSHFATCPVQQQFRKQQGTGPTEGDAA